MLSPSPMASRPQNPINQQQEEEKKEPVKTPKKRGRPPKSPRPDRSTTPSREMKTK